MTLFIRISILIAACLGYSAAAEDKQPAGGPAAMDAMQIEYDAAVAEAQHKSTKGPADVPLMDQATLKLPQGYTYFPGKEAGRLLRAMGNRVTEDPLGMVVGNQANQGDWFAVMQYDAAGYVKDDDAKEWNAEELLGSIRAGAAAANDERRAKGLPETEIIGWIQAPAYDSAQHRLVWSIASKGKGEPDSTERTVNYDTYALGREGYISLNLVTGASAIESEKRFAKELLAALNFNPGKSYAEFNSSTDKVAEYGLAALVGGVVAKKLGFFAMLAVFLAKFAKVIGVGALFGAAGLWKYFKNRKASRGVDSTA
ncbi:MAG: DUF2167 domain-containing protein [Betaproteobacteria bacterium]|nr:DUF2167 domain-containing protein [Betaproteobacteria bacterium]